MKALNPSHWTARESPFLEYFKCGLKSEFFFSTEDGEWRVRVWGCYPDPTDEAAPEETQILSYFVPCLPLVSLLRVIFRIVFLNV